MGAGKAKVPKMPTGRNNFFLIVLSSNKKRDAVDQNGLHAPLSLTKLYVGFILTLDL